MAETAERSYPDPAIEAIQSFHAQGWTDGLPVIPPTEEAVEWMLRGTDRERDEVIAELAPAWGEASVESIAINAVMAGCRPQMLPVVITAVQAVAEPRLNLSGRQTTTSAGAPLVIINGPLARELDVNAGINCFGSGRQANAVIGRALRLCLRNIGGGVPGKTDRSTMGHPGKYTYCIAENEEKSPWEPLHVERGLSAESSAVTVIWGEAPHNVIDQRSTSPEGILTNAASVMATLGNNLLYRPGEALIVICPEHAATIAEKGWGKEDVKRYLFEHARQPYGKVSTGGFFGAGDLPHWVDGRSDATMVPIVKDAQGILVVVAGGPGRHSMAVLTAGATASVTKLIALRDGKPARSLSDFAQAAR